MDDAGTGGEHSFAERFASALAAGRFQVLEIKAPRGRVRSRDDGKILIQPSAGDPTAAYVPSSTALNYYTGPEVQEKHRA